MRSIKRAVYQRIVGDARIMALLGNKGPFLGALPRVSPHSREEAAITIDGDTSIARGSKEEVTINLQVYSLSHDVVEEVAANLDRLFHPAPGRQWVPLSVADGQAFVRREFAADVPDPASELWHKVIRLRVHFGRAPA